jgi:hypothetical protein
MSARRRVAKRKGWPANLYQKPDGYFWYRNPESGKTKGLGRDRPHAFDEARAANLALASKKAASLADWVSGAETKTVAGFSLEYQERYLATHDKPNTIKQVQSTVRFIREAPFADKPINQVSTKDVSGWLKLTESERGPFAAKQRRRVLHDIFTEAVREGLIRPGDHPVEMTKQVSVKVSRDRLSLEQFLEVRAHADGWLVNVMNLAIISGQARAEIAGAMFADFKDGHWYCRRGKTGANIRIPLALRLDPIGLSLADVVKQCREDGIVSQYLIHHRKNSGRALKGAKVGVDLISTAFAEARERAGITPQDGKQPTTFHEIRSLAGRLYKQVYGEVEWVQRLFGHGEKYTTERYLDSRQPRDQVWIDVVAR